MANEDSFHLGIKALIKNKQGKVLVLKANVKDFAKKVPEHWDLPGGRVQKGDDVEKTLRREVEEEIGVKDIEVGELLDASVSKMRISSLDVGLILFTYLCTINDNHKIELTDQEHIDFIWCNPKKAAELLKTKFSDSLIEKVKDL